MLGILHTQESRHGPTETALSLLSNEETGSVRLGYLSQLIKFGREEQNSVC